MNTKSSSVLHLPAPKSGQVLVTAKPRITEREIVRDRDNIIQTLHAAYLTLNDSMAEFQKQWNANPAMSFIESARAGALQGGSAWVGDQATLFDKNAWAELGTKVENFAGACVDRMATYSKQQYLDLEREVNKHISNPKRTLYNWAWWQQVIGEQVQAAVEAQSQRLQTRVSEARRTAAAAGEALEKSRKIFKHRDAILNLPVLIATGDPKPIQAFVENELMDIDPVLAKAIRHDPNFAIVLEIIADNESVLSYLAYVSLMVESIPPNFYAFIAGKGAAYIVIETVLLVITALLSAGTVAAARVAALVTRLAMTSAKAANASAKVRRAKIAVDAFVRALQDLMRAVDEMHALGAKLVQVRGKGVTVRGNTATMLKTKKESIRRDECCRICKSTRHHTPRHQRGHVTYR